jgi:uncharacterized protein
MFFNLFVAFMTGLTTGGLSCLAVQGGLLASSLAQQIELDVKNKHAKTGLKNQKNPRIAVPILLFLVAKVFAYTILGFLLGMLGSVLQLTPLSRAILLFAIGIFMVGNALRMFNVHPIFRYFSIEPPSWLTRYIRRKSKNNADNFTPLFLGALTVLIPCGITQAMMAVALGSGSPMLGAATMFAFTLGTTPVFFSVAYFTTRLGSTMEKYFMRFVAVVVLLLGLWTIESGLNLVGSPYSVTNLTRSWFTSASIAEVPPLSPGVPTPAVSLAGSGPTEPTALPNVATGEVILQIDVQNSGYSPDTLHAPANVPIRLNMVTQNTHSCAVAFVIPELGIEKLLPSSGTTELNVPPQPQGKVMRFSCSMGMYTGQIIFDKTS